MAEPRRATAVIATVLIALAACAAPGPTAAPPETNAGAGAPSPSGPGTTAARAPDRTAVPDTSAPRRGATADTAFPELGNLDIDVTHYDLVIDYDVERRELRADATVSLVPRTDLREVALDLRGLTVDEVTVGHAPAAFTTTDTKLVVEPADRLRSGSSYDVVVRYHGSPAPVPTEALGGVEVGWHASPSGSFVLAEPEGASTWFPVNNHPRDKATYTITVTVPEPYVAIASGRLDKTDERGGERSYRWVMDHPMANYLATVVTGEFEEQDLGDAGGVSYSNWVPKDTGGEGGSFLGEEQVVRDLEAHLGPFPFATYGAVVYPTSFIQGSRRTKQFLSGVALEAQGRSLYAEYVASGDTVVHETAHQWMGDSVSLTDWSQDIWWVEGFARYTELWDSADRDAAFRRSYAEVRAEWIPPGRLPVDELFGHGSYTEGSLVFYALEQEVGAATFDRILQAFVSRYRDANASTEDLIAVASEVSGRDLTDFFDGWLFADRPPPFPS